MEQIATISNNSEAITHPLSEANAPVDGSGIVILMENIQNAEEVDEAAIDQGTSNPTSAIEYEIL